MSDGIEKRRRAVWSIRTLMVVVLVVALDTVLAKGLAGARTDAVSAPLLVVIVIAYDALAYFSWLAVVEVVRGRTGRTGWPAYIVIAASVLILATCAGLPLAIAALAILGVMK